MFKVKDILTYLRVRILPTTYDFSADDSDALHQNNSFSYIKLCLIGITSMIIFTVAAISWDQREEIEQGLRDGELFARLEQNLLSRVYSAPGPGIEGRILPTSDLPSLDENDNFMLPPPAIALDEDVDRGGPDEMRTAAAPDFV